jgi:hypothetical protein
VYYILICVLYTDMCTLYWYMRTLYWYMCTIYWYMCTIYWYMCTLYWCVLYTDICVLPDERLFAVRTQVSRVTYSVFFSDRVLDVDMGFCIFFYCFIICYRQWMKRNKVHIYQYIVHIYQNFLQQFNVIYTNTICLKHSINKYVNNT